MSTHATTRQRVEMKLRTFYAGLPAEEQRVLAQLMAPADDPPSVEGLADMGKTAPSFDAVFATRLLELPEFERTAALPESVEATASPATAKTATFERQT